MMGRKEEEDAVVGDEVSVVCIGEISVDGFWGDGEAALINAAGRQKMVLQE